MRLLTFFKLRTTIPLIILLYSLAMGLIFLCTHLPRDRKNIEEAGQREVQIQMTQLRRSLAYFLLRDNIPLVQQQLSILSLNPRSKHTFLICDRGMVLAASQLGHINKKLDSIRTNLSSQEQELLRSGPTTDTLSGIVNMRLSADGNGLLATTSLALPTDAKLTHGGHRQATLYYYYDLQMATEAAHQSMRYELLTDSALMGLLALALWAYFHLVVSRRITHLTTMAQEIGQGDYGAHANISGKDELAALAHTFEEMRDNLLRSFETIRFREESLQETQAIAHLGSWEFDTLSRKLWWSAETYHLFGFKETEQVTFEKFLAALHPEDQGRIQTAIYDSISQARGVAFDYRILRKDGSLRYLHEESQVVTDGTGKVVKRKGSVQDVTERRQAELAMEKSMQEWSAAMDASDDILFLLDLDRHLIRANRRFYLNTSSTPDTARGRHIDELMHPSTDAQNCPVCRAQEERRDAVITLEPDDTYNQSGRPLQATVKVVRDKQGKELSILVTIHDLTNARQAMEERAQLERQLHQAQKMEAVGTLAGGIAHDFNNILTPIIGYTEMAMANLPAESQIAQDLAQVLKAGSRAKDLVGQILSFSRQDDQERHPLEIQLVIKEALKLLRASIPTSIDIKTKIAKECGPVLAAPTQIHQIIMNLCTNAYQAMRDTGGVLTVTLAPCTLGPGDLDDMAELEPGNYVRLEISDTGQGMSQAVREKIFDPYFTTKEKGEGTGLGLSVVQAIVASLDGHIAVASELGKGTSFEIYLPVSAESCPTTKISSSKTQLPGGQERLLVVDDEEAIANLIKQMMIPLGYQVTACTSPETALAAFKEQPQAFDLLITDMTMPRMDGARLSKEILSLRPAMPIILCTGYSSLISAEEAAAIGISRFIMKPVVKSDLAQAVRELLDARPSS